MSIKNEILMFPKEIRVGFALFLGFIIIMLTHYGSNETKTDVLFAEMVHTIADTLVILIFFFSIQTNGKHLRVLSKASGVLLILAGLAAFLKTYTTFVLISVGGNPAITRGSVLFFISLIVIFLIAAQMFLVWDDHGILHGEIEDVGHKKNVHHATKTELLADITQAFSGLVVYIATLLLPNSPVTVRYIDFLITILIGGWMGYRGIVILIGKHHHH